MNCQSVIGNHLSSANIWRLHYDLLYWKLFLVCVTLTLLAWSDSFPHKSSLLLLTLIYLSIYHRHHHVRWWECPRSWSYCCPCTPPSPSARHQTTTAPGGWSQHHEGLETFSTKMEQLLSHYQFVSTEQSLSGGFTPPNPWWWCSQNIQWFPFWHSRRSTNYGRSHNQVSRIRCGGSERNIWTVYV